MSKEKLLELRFVIVAFIIGSVVLMGCAMRNFNMLDLLYILFLISCVVRYIYITKKN